LNFSSIMCDYIFKILLVGDMGVGKSSLVWRFTENHFTRNYYETTGIEYKNCPLEVAGNDVVLQLWDAAGEERFRTTVKSYCRNSHGVIVVYDTTSLSSFRHLGSWLKDLGVYCCKGVNIMLVGTKCDQLEKRQVAQERACRFAELRGLTYIETSAKSGVNVKKVFETLAVEVYNRLAVDNGDRLQDGQDKMDKKQGNGEGDVPPPSTSSKKRESKDCQ
ncbi:hypothetical protein KR038_003910, partial [Drosophila bunnanda]